ncbi:MAG: DUF3368 domain-containing protein [Chromatiaceae bacterium]
MVNASPLILLGKATDLWLLGRMADRIDVPAAVADEVGAKPDGREILEAIAQDPAFAIVDKEVATPEILSWDLGSGETQVIAHALAQHAERVVIDDREARRCAMSMGLAVIGTLGIIGRAKTTGLIDRAEPVVKRLLATGLYASDELVRRLLIEVGE